MRILILLIAITLLSCKKQEPQPETKTSTLLTSAPDKTVSISCQSGCNGQLRIVWDYDHESMPIDSVYTYSTNKIFTKVVSGDSIRLYFYSSICTSCSPCTNQVTLYVNGIVNTSWSNDVGAVFNKIKL